MGLRSRVKIKAMSAAACALLLATPLLQGCAIVNGAAAVSRAVVASSNAVTRTVVNSSNAIARSVSRIPAQTMYNAAAPRRVVIPSNQPSASQVAAARTRAAKQAAKQQAAKNKKMSKERSEILEVMPPELLDQLTKDELILQSIIQLDALDGPGKEVVYWDLNGRAGTASAEEATTHGGFKCRVITETLKLDDSGEATESKATACKTESTSWTLSF
jgi:hypothetical protein